MSLAYINYESRAEKSITITYSTRIINNLYINILCSSRHMFDEFCQNVKFDFRIYKPNKHKMSLNVKLGGLSRIFTAVDFQSS